MRATPSDAALQLAALMKVARRVAAIAVVIVLPVISACDRETGSSVAQPLAPAPVNGEVVLSSAVIQKLGVRTMPVDVTVLPNDARVPAVIAYDERSIIELYAPIAGWVDHASVRARGERVRADQLLFELYSPVLVTTDAQYLKSLETGSDPVDNAYARGLLALGLSEDMVTALRDRRRKVGRIPFRARSDAVVTAINFRQGALVLQGANVMQLADPDRVWAILQVPEAMVASVVPGTLVSVTAPAYPGWKHEAKISHVYPQLDGATRTIQARVVLPSRDPVLFPEMYVSVVIHGAGGEPVANVPSDAVIRSEAGDRVIVALGNGRFAQRAVQIGRASDDRTAILSGLRAGEQVVTRAAFLIDSEASLRSGLARLDESADEAAPTAPVDPHAKHHH